jgi:hypothetical protein
MASKVPYYFCIQNSIEIDDLARLQAVIFESFLKPPDLRGLWDLIRLLSDGNRYYFVGLKGFFSTK